MQSQSLDAWMDEVFAFAPSSACVCVHVDEKRASMHTLYLSKHVSYFQVSCP
jgi:hypothetical protein